MKKFVLVLAAFAAMSVVSAKKNYKLWSDFTKGKAVRPQVFVNSTDGAMLIEDRIYYLHRLCYDKWCDVCRLCKDKDYEEMYENAGLILSEIVALEKEIEHLKEILND